ncbi:MAG: hypothetical protein OEY59_00345 [Deltaproteobacteria bacterium]|nr:hypothetical protein [Deltaproteobacteria bacterium]
MSPIAEKNHFVSTAQKRKPLKPLSERILDFLEVEHDPNSVYGLFINTAPFWAIVIPAMVLIIVYV